MRWPARNSGRCSTPPIRWSIPLAAQAIVPGGQPAVFKVVDGKAKLIKIRIGVRRAAQVEVVEGLAEGDGVVTAGQLKLRDGAAVKAIGEGVPASTQGNGAAAGQGGLPICVSSGRNSRPC